MQPKRLSAGVRLWPVFELVDRFFPISWGDLTI